MKPHIPALLSLVLIVSVQAAPINIQPGNNSNVAVQSAINSAASGSVILLKSGVHTFTGEVNLPASKSKITIRGETGTIVRKASSSNISAFRVDGNDYVFDKLEIDGASKPSHGVLVYGDRTKFQNCNFHHCGESGILFHEAFDSVVIGGSYSNNGGVGISQFNSHGGDIVGTSATARVTASNNGLEGITIDLGSDNCFVQYVTANTNKGGVGNVGIDDTNGSWLYDSTFNGHTKRSGVTFQNNEGPCDGPRIWRCNLKNNTHYPIHIRNVLHDVTNYGFDNNSMTGNKKGDIVFKGETPRQ